MATLPQIPFGFDAAERLFAGEARLGAALGNPPPSPEPSRAPRLQSREIGAPGSRRAWALVFRGGHVVEAVVWPTPAVFLTESTVPLPKKKDPEAALGRYGFE